MSFVHSLGAGLILLGVLLGTAWAVAYTTGPMIISELVDDKRRGVYIGYVTGMIQIGFGLGPILGNAILHLGMSFESVFRCAGALSVLAALAVVALGRLAPELSRARRFGTAHQSSLSRDLAGIARSPAMIPLVMVLLCACVFTTMNSFQTTFADRRELNFDVFYASYTVAVIFARFVLVRVLPDPTSTRTLRGSTAGIVVSILAFAESDAQAREYAWPIVVQLTQQLRQSRTHEQPHAIVSAPDLEPERFYHDIAIVGGPDTVTRRIAELRDEYHIRYVNLRPSFSGICPLPLQRTTVALFASEVIPRLAQPTTP